MRFPLLAKAVALAVVIVVLAWALSVVRDIVAEREGRLREAERSVADSLAASQSLLGPILQRSCVERWITFQGDGKDRKPVAQQRSFALYAVPDTLQMTGTARGDARYRGIFKVNGYLLQARFEAAWTDLSSLQPRREHEGSEVSCLDPVIWVGVGDPRGIRSAGVSAQGAELPVLPGTTAPGAPSGFHAALPIGGTGEATFTRASVDLELVGTGSLAFSPVGKSTRVSLSSDWPHPSFTGRFLPVTRQVSAAGFQANWEVNALASEASQQLRGGQVHCPHDARPVHTVPPRGCIETFGVSFINPVNAYVLSDRATKYGLLFIALTFAAVGLVEVLRQLRVHPIQYLLVGAALTVFFLLLVSLSEHLPFAGAYLIASLACTALLAYYGAHVLHSARAGLIFGAGVGLVYAVLYLLLVLEQNALVLGAILLFCVLASAMVATRKIDWYGVINQARLGKLPGQAGKAG